MLTLTFEIMVDSNYHVGAGYGKGFGLDSAILRESDGTPVLRGSALSGLLRDGAYRLLNLPPLKKYSATESTDEILKRLFGSPKQAKRWRIASAHPSMKFSADTKVVQRVRIDPRMRRAEPGKLFSQEEGVAGQAFVFTINCPNSGKAELDDAAILIAAARFVRQFGRSRNRGLGECSIHLLDAIGIDESQPPTDWEKWFLDRFNRVWLQGNPTKIVEAAIKSDIQAIDVPTGTGVCIRMIVRLDEPLLIAQRAESGNQFDTRPLIPGSALLGALAGMAAERCKLADQSDYRDFVALFLRGGIAFPMLYPAYYGSSNIYPAIPAPLDLMTCSVVPFEVNEEGHGLFHAEKDKKCPAPECCNRLEPLDGFLLLKNLEPFTLRPQRSSELHIRIDEKTRRAAKGDLYGYSTLSSGQYFVGEMLCADEKTWQRLQEMTGIAEKKPLTLRLGKARWRGYGQVTVWLERYGNKPQTWIQLPLNERIKDLTQPFTLTLLTDTIIANPWGQQAIGFSEDWIEPILGFKPGELEIKDAYARIRIVDSFNSTLGLPRGRDTALMAGSSACICLKNPPPDGWAERMEKLELEGIGVRRNEGFGRIAFNHPVYEQRQSLSESAIRIGDEMRLDSVLSHDMFMQEWDEELRKLLPQGRCHDGRFQALARWLHTHSEMAPQKWIDQLTSIGEYEMAFGQPDKALITAIGEKEYGKRNKDNFFIKDKKGDVEAICKALEWLKDQDKRQWRGGIERLAGWIATLARDKQNGGM